MKKYSILSMAGVVLLSVAFALPVLAGGDSPQEVYALYIAAQRDGNIEDMCKYVNDGRVQQFQSLSSDQKVELSKTMKQMAPTEYTVIKEDIHGNSVTLTLTGKTTDFGGSSRKHRGKARFVKEDGEWKLAQEVWK